MIIEDPISDNSNNLAKMVRRWEHKGHWEDPG